MIRSPAAPEPLPGSRRHRIFRPLRLLTALLLAPAVVLAAPRARAFCRTTAEVIPADYNPVVSGCLNGTPLAWTTMPVSYQIFQGASAQVSLAEATPIIDAAFAKWPAASCSPTDASKHPDLSIEDNGITDAPDPCEGAPCDLTQYAAHAIYFRDDSWPYTDSANEIALTTVTYGVDDGRIFSAIMEINSHDNEFSVSSPPAEGAISLEAVVTHEAGHFVGMAHSQDTGAIMYAYYRGDEVTLTADDEEGICTVYPPAPSGCSCHLVRGGRGEGWPLAGGLARLAVATYRRRRPRLL